MNASRAYQSGRILPVRALTVLKNVLFCFTWLYCSQETVVDADQFTILLFALVITKDRWLRVVCSASCVRLLYLYGVRIFASGAYATCLMLCTWLMRDPHISNFNWLFLTAYWVYMATTDSHLTCTNAIAAMPPLLPIYVAISQFHARPVALLVIGALPALL